MLRLPPRPLSRRPRPFAARLAVIASLVLFPAVARAQAVSASGSHQYPERFVGGQDLGLTTRSPGLNPYGVNYKDCINDMTLQFSVALSGFTKDTLLDAWAGLQGVDCTQDSARASGGACWEVIPLPVAGLTDAASSPPISVRVQDLVGPQGQPSAGIYGPVGIEACSAQTDYRAVPMTIWFMPTDSGGHIPANATVFAYSITTDLLGPPPPFQGRLTVGDTFLTANWTPNSDPDTVGYDVFRDPPPGDAGLPASGTPTQGCPDGGDAGCVQIVSGGTTIEAGACNSENLAPTGASSSGGSTTDGGADTGATGAADTGTATTDASSDGAAPVETGNGGINTIPTLFLATDPSADMSVAGQSGSSLQMNGLVDGTPYGVVVAAVDGSGNVGPQSNVQCDSPDVIQDFFQTYARDGGGIGCALAPEGPSGAAMAGGLGVALGAAAWRRRRRRA